MAWRTVTESDLLQKFSGDELEALRSAGLASGQADPIAGNIRQLVDFVRGYISTHPSNRLGPDGTLPERLILPAIDYLVVDVSSRVAGMLIDLNDTRKGAKADAVRLFERVSVGLFRVEDATEFAADSAPVVAVEQAGGSPNNVSRDTLAGL